MRTKTSYKPALLSGIGALLLITASASVLAEDIDISHRPLFLSSSVAPNIFFEVDDSGSMDWEILTQPHWQRCAYDATDSQIANGVPETETQCGDIVSNGLWDIYHPDNETNNGGGGNGGGRGGGGGGPLGSPSTKGYIYANNDNVWDLNCSSTLEACDSNFSTNSAYLRDWRIFSSGFNQLYFNPAETYLPWNGFCAGNADGDDDNTVCQNASFNSVISDPRAGKQGSSLQKNLNGFVFEVWTDNKGYSGDRPLRGTDINDTDTPNGMVDLWDTHRQYIVQQNSVQIRTTSYNPNSTGLAPTISDTTTLAGAGCHPELGFGRPEGCRTVAQLQQEIANWYQYYRKRSYVAKNALASVVSNNPTFRYGLSVLNEYENLFVPVPGQNETNFTSHNQSMLTNLFDLDWPSEGTPLRQGLQRVGQYFDNTLTIGGGGGGRGGGRGGQNNNDNGIDPDDPIIGTCQKNFAVLFTDGYWNGDTPTGIGNEDGDSVNGTTLADVAKYYYDLDLSPLANLVPTDNFDNNPNQHMVTFTVGYGVQGNLVDTDTPPDNWPDNASGNNLVENSDWGNPTGNADTPAKIDDLWHAAYNSRGRYVSASTASEVVTALESALDNIDQRISSGASVSLNSGMISDSTTVYQARFNSLDWSGEIKAMSINPDTGELGENQWTNNNTIPNPGQRQILTHNGSTVNNGGASFRWESLNNQQQQQLRENLNDSDDNEIVVANARLNYLRGQTINEQRNGGLFRDRAETVLGDIINSSPAYVSEPNFNYPDTLESSTGETNYSDFFTTNRDRTPMIYVGANDGMMHAIDTTTGTEKMAYVPRAVYPNLYRLTQPDYNHRFYVDGSPTVGDAYFDPDAYEGGNKSWHTVLVGGLNNGGQGIYALDVTNPDIFDEDQEEIVLWEFTDEDDMDMDGDGDNDPLPADYDTNGEAADSMRYALGNTFSRPAIVRLNNGRWAAIFGNGYNNTQGQKNRSLNGDAVLYILDIGTGKVIRKLSTYTGRDEDPASRRTDNGSIVSLRRPNGLATTAPVDVNGDHKVDFVFAGDLFGNLWKFDLRSEFESEWGSAFENSGQPIPLFTACSGVCESGLNNNHQAITSRPEVGRAPNRHGLMIFFGTGQYLGAHDTSNQSLQSFYAIIDDGEVPLTGRDELLQQSILLEGISTFNGNQAEVRITSNSVLTATHRGWFLDLDSPNISGTEGERVVQTPLLRSGRIIFPTMTPNTNICGLGGSSWLMELDAFSGSRLNTTAFDLSGDNQFGTQDLYTIPGAGGSQSVPVSGVRHEELISSPSVINAEGRELKLTSGSSGNVKVTVESQPTGSVNRQSWRQLR